MPGNERKWRSVRQAQVDDEARAGCSSGVGGAPAGGPLVVPGFVSGPIRVHDLQHSWLTLLSVLESDLGDVMMEEFNDPDIVVDDLKIVTDAELVEKALAEVLQGKNALLDCRRLEDGRSQGGEGAHGTAGLEGQSFTGLLLGDDECTHEAGLDKNKTTAQELSIVPFVGVGDNAGQHDGGAALIESGVEPGAELQAIETSQAIVPMQEVGDDSMQHYEGSVALIEAGVEPGAELQAIEASQPKQKEKKRKRGRPYDRDVRAAELGMDAAAIQREEILTRMKQEREAAKQSSNLHSLRFKQEREAADAGNKNQLRKLRFLTTAIKFPTTTTPEVTEEEAVESTEIVLVVELYHGLKKHTKTQEFLVLGSQPLTALRDRLYCLTDELAQEAKLNVPSGYFLIEDVFYNDMRNPKAIDYSEPIIKWTRETKEATERWKAVGGAARKSSGTINQNSDSVSLPSFRTASMADTSFSDLQLRIGSQYLYCHQGDCKHMLVIRDIRLIHPEDVQKVAAYPVLRWHPRARIRKLTLKFMSTTTSSSSSTFFLGEEEIFQTAESKIKSLWHHFIADFLGESHLGRSHFHSSCKFEAQLTERCFHLQMLTKASVCCNKGWITEMWNGDHCLSPEGAMPRVVCSHQVWSGKINKNIVGEVCDGGFYFLWISPLYSFTARSAFDKDLPQQLCDYKFS